MRRHGPPIPFSYTQTAHPAGSTSWASSLSAPGTDSYLGRVGPPESSTGKSRFERRYRGERWRGLGGEEAMMEKGRYLVGVDQGREHEVVILSSEGASIARRRVEHGGGGLRELVAWVRGHCGGSFEGVLVATETPRGALVEAFVGAGATVYAINPKQLDRFRDRRSPSGAKDDGRDAWVLADGLRTDRAAFNPVSCQSALVEELRELGRLRDRMVDHQGRLTNQLQCRLAEVWPELLRWSPGADEPWLWSLLKKAPTPHRAGKLQKRTLAALLREHRIRRIKPRDLRQTLQEPILPFGKGTWSAARKEILLLADQCRLTHQQLREIEDDLKALLERAVEQEEEGEEGGGPGDAEIILSFPGAGLVVATRMLGEAAHLLRDYRRLRIVTGVAPVTKASGRQRMVIRRRACKPRLSDAVFHWARNAIQKDPHLRRKYDGYRQRGHTHGRALRQLGDYLLRCLCAALRSRTSYCSPADLETHAA